MKIKVINAMFIILVLAALSALTFFVRVGATADTVVVLDIAGMTCGSCVDKIKKTLQSEQGVASVQVDIDSGQAVVGYAADRIKPGTIAAAVAGLGFECRIVEVSSLAKFKAGHKNMAAGLEKTSGCSCCNE